MAYIVMACAAIAYILKACIVMAYIRAAHFMGPTSAPPRHNYIGHNYVGHLQGARVQAVPPVQSMPRQGLLENCTAVSIRPGVQKD